MAKKARKKSRTSDILIAAVGIGIVVAIFAAGVIFAPDSPFSDTEFVKDIGHRNAY